MKTIITGTPKLGDIETKDEGQIVDIKIEDDNNPIEVTLSSFCENGEHKELEGFVNKKIRITIEILD